MSITRVQLLEMFRSLIKDGCKWAGDTDIRSKWHEVLYFEDTEEEKVKLTLAQYPADCWKIEGEYPCYWVWIKQ